jgi:hypothetical protein
MHHTQLRANSGTSPPKRQKHWTKVSRPKQRQVSAHTSHKSSFSHTLVDAFSAKQTDTLRSTCALQNMPTLPACIPIRHSPSCKSVERRACTPQPRDDNTQLCVKFLVSWRMTSALLKKLVKSLKNPVSTRNVTPKWVMPTAAATPSGYFGVA